jgi:hypothetical protein
MRDEGAAGPIPAACDQHQLSRAILEPSGF